MAFYNLIAQIAGAILGKMLAHAMFEQSIWQLSTHARTRPAHWLSEIVATFGLVGTIFAAFRWRPDGVAWIVGLYITTAYWFTASTSFPTLP